MRGEIPLETRHGNHSFDVALAKNAAVYFYLEGKSSERNLNWSEWLEASWDAGTARPTAEEESYNLRHKLRYRPEEVDVPVPMEPSAAEEAAARFAALTPASPLREWMRYLRYDGSKERVTAAAAVVEQRQEELAKMMRSADVWEREAAMEAVPYFDQTGAEVQAAVLQEGRLIVGELRKVAREAPDLRGRFNRWGPAWWAAHRKVDGFDSGTLREIWALARDFGAEGRGGAERAGDTGETGDVARGALEQPLQEA